MPYDRLHRALVAALGKSAFANITAEDIDAVRACGDTIVYRPGDTVRLLPSRRPGDRRVVPAQRT
jgi:hypothetical protein